MLSTLSTLQWILAFCLLGGVLSVLAAAVVTRALGASAVSVLVSYAIGAMLGAVFLEILPHAIESTPDPHTLPLVVLVGILVFFLLEKLVLWRHCHHSHCEVHEPPGNGHDHGRSGVLVLIGDTFHNFVDGILIAAAFIQSPELGVVTAAAIIAHEIPQELGDFVVLLHSGFSRAKALAFNAISGLAMVLGGLVGYLALSVAEQWIPSILGIAAASMLYVAVADLIPGLHKRTDLRATIQQVALILLGVGSIWLVGELVSH